jgi:CheY-like chemotaxis protein
MHKDLHQGHRILVIDDSEVMLARIKRALVADGHTVTTTAQTVGSARHLAACDLVIIDYHMPGIDGMAVQEQLRGAAAHLEKPPLFYLYTSDPSVVAHAKGFDGCFTNKGDEALLVQQVRAVFRLSQIRAMTNRPRSSPPGPPAAESSTHPSAMPPPPESRPKGSVPPPSMAGWTRTSSPPGPGWPESSTRPSSPPVPPDSRSNVSVPPSIVPTFKRHKA